MTRLGLSRGADALRNGWSGRRRRRDARALRCVPHGGEPAQRAGPCPVALAGRGDGMREALLLALALAKRNDTMLPRNGRVRHCSLC